MRHGPWLLLTALLASTANASVEPALSSREAPAITRLDDIRSALQGVQTAAAKSEKIDDKALSRLAQWYNWANWPNWNNWGNWGNWGNWFNG